MYCRCLNNPCQAAISLVSSFSVVSLFLFLLWIFVYGVFWVIPISAHLLSRCVRLHNESFRHATDPTLYQVCTNCTSLAWSWMTGVFCRHLLAERWNYSITNWESQWSPLWHFNDFIHDCLALAVPTTIFSRNSEYHSCLLFLT